MSDAPAAEVKLRLHPRQNNGGTAYREQGSGEAIVMVHGVGLNADAWEPQIAELSRTHRVIAVDLLGHGESALPPPGAKLDTYVQQLATLLDQLGINAANIIGHSMGGLVAIGFAVAHPARTLRLAVLNSVYKRPADKRAAVLQRAADVRKSGTVGNVDEPLERWFGPADSQHAVAARVRSWLASTNPQGYATAYSVFAESDEAFAGRLGALTMPSLFATGSLDGNSSPEMAAAMAGEAPNGKALVLEGERHMMNLTSADAVNAALGSLLLEKSSAIDARDLRRAFGTFMTGVTIVTTREADGSLRGFTANSFSSVSLDPPLLLVCISKFAASCDVFSQTATFAVNILSESQKSASGIFASKRADKFTEVNYSDSATGNPLISGSVAWFDCERHSVVDAGDHIILVGRVTSYAHNDANPLGYGRGGYFTLGLEQSAINAAAQAGRTEVGAILEADGKLLVFPSPTGGYELPHVGRSGDNGSASRLLSSLGAQGITAKLGFLYAVYENAEDKTQCIYYRGDASGAESSKAVTLPFDALPLEKFRDYATRTMLSRYCSERLEGRYRIYSGDHVRGDVRDVGE